MIVVPLEAASKANEFSLTPKAFTVSSESNGVGDVNRTATRRTFRPLGVNLLELHHDLGACARRPHRRDP
jgi:hypothetical protein